MGDAEDPHASRIDEELRRFLEAQPMFFVATAPLAADGHVNVSPKGLDSFRVLDEHTVAFVDRAGSGAETIAHVRENGRIVLLFCAFTGRPRIERIHGVGEVLEPGTAAFDELATRLPGASRARSILRIRVERRAKSCGFGVPRMTLDRQRTELEDWAEAKGPRGVADYQRRKNRRSLDGLPTLRWLDDDRAG